MIVKLLTDHHLEFLSLKGGCRGSPESTHVKMSNCRTGSNLIMLKPAFTCARSLVNAFFIDCLDSILAICYRYIFKNLASVL